MKSKLLYPSWKVEENKPYLNARNDIERLCKKHDFKIVSYSHELLVDSWAVIVEHENELKGLPSYITIVKA